MLTEAQLQEFEDQGYLALGQIASDAQLSQLQQRLDDLTLGSLHNERITYQIERKLKEKLGVQEKYIYIGPSKSYRKLMHLEEDPLFKAYFSHPIFRSILRQLIGPDVSISRAYALLKPAFDGSPLAWHQDAGPGHPLGPNHFCTVWTAIDEAQFENGGLEILLGSHKKGLLDRSEENLRRVRADADQRVREHVALAAKPGEAYLLNNYALHRSGPNPTPNRRRAVTICYKDAGMPMMDRPANFHLDFKRLPMN